MNFEKKVSVGYNRAGQDFFDTLLQYKDFIHSYFFNPSFNFKESFPWEDELEQMRKLNSYGIPGNILFNFPSQKERPQDNIKILESFLKLTNLNIDAVTVLNQTTINYLKQVNFALRFHISVLVPINSLEDITEKFNIEDIYCVNLNQKDIFNLDLITEVHDVGIKVKLITSEMCMKDRNNWANYFFGENICKLGGYCGQGCRNKFSGEYAWLDLTRQGFTKEFVPYYNDKLDIIKMATRRSSLNAIRNMLELWFSDRISKNFDRCFFHNGIPSSFIKKRFECDHRCKECLFCKRIYDECVIKQQ